jgi:hypothetical protein
VIADLPEEFQVAGQKTIVLVLECDQIIGDQSLERLQFDPVFAGQWHWGHLRGGSGKPLPR